MRVCDEVLRLNYSMNALGHRRRFDHSRRVVALEAEEDDDGEKPH